jgi:hypothetical protein
MAGPERFELPTNWFEASYSIQLSYEPAYSLNEKDSVFALFFRFIKLCVDAGFVGRVGFAVP